MENLKLTDPDLFHLIGLEQERQEEVIELIASENIVSKSVQEAVGSILTNKYAEGYPGKRYYGGCHVVDEIESLAVQRALELFPGAEHANVQPHSGSQANAAVYQAFLKLGDTVLGMDLNHGGHLTHGCPVNFSGKNYNFVSYGVDSTGSINYEEVLAQAKKCQPKMIVAGASAYPRAIDFEKFSEIAKEVGAYLFVDMAHIAGLVAAGLHQSPMPYADVVTTTTHKTLRGPRGGVIFCKKEYSKKIDSAIFPGLQGGPLMHVIAGKAACFKEAMSEEFKEYQKTVLSNTQALAEAFNDLGVSLVTGGSDNHLMLLDLTHEPKNGAELQAKLDATNITANKNTIPGDPLGPMVTSGLRVGLPAATTFGFKPKHMKELARIIVAVLRDAAETEELKKAVLDLISSI